jgi:GNAT superfamily N-acetyltransferase
MGEHPRCRPLSSTAAGGYGAPVPDALTIRPLRPDDHRAWGILWDGYLRFYREELAPEVTAESFRRLCAGVDGVFALVACGEDGEPVGFAHAILHPSTWSPAGYCYLEDLYVDPGARGGDAGRLLIDAVAAGAEQRGATKLYWHTQAFNGRARSLYDQVGHLSSEVVYHRDLPA